MALMISSSKPAIAFYILSKGGGNCRVTTFSLQGLRFSNSFSAIFLLNWTTIVMDSGHLRISS